MPKTCDNKSVGVIIKDGNNFAVIKRKNFPVAFAFVAGHLDGDTFEDAARKEASEEASITILKLRALLPSPRHFPNPCKRDGGLGHEWQVFEAVSWTGDLRASSDAKEAFWATPEELARLADRSRYFLKKHGFPLRDFDLSRATPAIDADPLWQKNPGLELVWLTLLEMTDIIP